MPRETFSYRPKVQKYVNTVLTHEWAEKQRVSFLEIQGIGKSRIRALWQAGISTADAVLATPTDEVVRRILEHIEWVRVRDVEDWKSQITALLREREHLVRGPLGWEDADSANAQDEEAPHGDAATD